MIATTSQSHLVPFGCLLANESAQIRWMEGDEHAVVRLQEMGIRPGANVQMLRPGSPNLIVVDGRRFSLRIDETVEILVEPQNN